jgi:hypothetical protein
MFIHIVRSLDCTEGLVRHHAGSPIPSHLCSLVLPLLAPLTTVTLKPFCLISIENFPALVGLSYSTATLVGLSYSTAVLVGLSYSTAALVGLSYSTAALVGLSYSTAALVGLS